MDVGVEHCALGTLTLLEITSHVYRKGPCGLQECLGRYEGKKNIFIFLEI